MKIFSAQIREFVPAPMYCLGTDGFGRSDTREALRHFFEVDYKFIVVTALKALADQKAIPAKTVEAAIKKFGIDPNKVNPVNH